ncbi:uncharacterized protein [Argopecten irradians]|uniref:uncharacterized protein n=1 Tax=Argopecten irradians TaxID=31199 RepID=UPI00371E1ABE
MEYTPKTTAEKNKQLDKEFFSPPNPRGEKNFFLECPPIAFGVLLAASLLVYRIKKYPQMKARGHDMMIYLYNTRAMVCGSISGLATLTVVSAKLMDGNTGSRPRYMGDHTPRKLPNQKLKPMTENPMVLIKTDIMEQVLLQRFHAKVETD